MCPVVGIGPRGRTGGVLKITWSRFFHHPSAKDLLGHIFLAGICELIVQRQLTFCKKAATNRKLTIACYQNALRV